MFSSYWNLITSEYPISSNLLSRENPTVNTKRWKLVTPSVGQVVTTEEAKLYMKVENTIEDDLVDSLIKTATFFAERYTKKIMLLQKWSMMFDWTPNSNEIEITPVGNQTIDKINYYDLNNVAHIWNSSNYYFDVYDDINPARVVLNYNTYYPTDLRARNSFEVLFFAGYANASLVPEDIKTAIKIIAQNLYEDREGVMSDKEGADHGANGLPVRARQILSQYRVYNV